MVDIIVSDFRKGMYNLMKIFVGIDIVFFASTNFTDTLLSISVSDLHIASTLYYTSIYNTHGILHPSGLFPHCALMFEY